MATNLELWMSCTCPIRKMGGQYSEHVETCPVRSYLAAEDAEMREITGKIAGHFREAPVVASLATLWVLFLFVGLPVGAIWLLVWWLG